MLVVGAKQRATARSCRRDYMTICEFVANGEREPSPAPAPVRNVVHCHLPSEDPAHRSTTFGRYNYTVAAEGLGSVDGVLPLKVNAGHIVLDVLFFAPALFFNIQDPVDEYLVDIARGTIRFRNGEHGEWQERPIHPTQNGSNQSEK